MFILVLKPGISCKIVSIQSRILVFCSELSNGWSDNRAEEGEPASETAAKSCAANSLAGTGGARVDSVVSALLKVDTEVPESSALGLQAALAFGSGCCWWCCSSENLVS